jgi:hypothetical protein
MVFDLLFLWVFVRSAQVRSEPKLGVVENAGRAYESL